MFNKYILMTLCLLSLLTGGCATTFREPQPRSLITARVQHIVELSAYQRVKNGNVSNPLGFPWFSEIHDAVKEGVTEEDVRAGCLVILKCAVGRGWWQTYIALASPAMAMTEGEHAELEAGRVRRYHAARVGLFPQSATLSKIVRVIPEPAPKDTFDVFGLLIKCQTDKN